MKTFQKALIGGAAALTALAGLTTAAQAQVGVRVGVGIDARPDHCRLDHDHRFHAANYYDYYPADRYYRANPRWNGRYDRYDRYDRRAYRGRGRNRAIVNTRVVDVRGPGDVLVRTVRERGPRARRTRGPDVTCIVETRGRTRIGRRGLRAIAADYCPRRARIVIS